MADVLYHPEIGTVIMFREGFIKVRKPRKLRCGYHAEKGDPIYQRVECLEGKVYTEERCWLCEASLRGYEYDGPRRHGNPPEKVII